MLKRTTSLKLSPVPVWLTQNSVPDWLDESYVITIMQNRHLNTDFLNQFLLASSLAATLLKLQTLQILRDKTAVIIWQKGLYT